MSIKNVTFLAFVISLLEFYVMYSKLIIERKIVMRHEIVVRLLLNIW
jgi:hypothetical protein